MNALEEFKAEARKVTLAVRDWGNSLAKQEFDNDPVNGMEPSKAVAALEAAATKYADERLRAELEGLYTSENPDTYGLRYVDLDKFEARLSQLTAEGK